MESQVSISGTSLLDQEQSVVKSPWKLLSEPTAVGNGEGARPLRLSPVLVQGNALFGKYVGLLLTLRSLHLTWEVSEI